MRLLRLRRVLSTTWRGRKFIRGTLYEVGEGEAGEMLASGYFEDTADRLAFVRADSLRGIARQNGEVVVVRDGGLGDLLMLLPALRALRAALPRLAVALSCDGRYRGLVGPPLVDRVVSLEEGAELALPAVELRNFVEGHGQAVSRPRQELFGLGLGVQAAPPPCAPLVVPEALDWIARELRAHGVGAGEPLVVAAVAGTSGHRTVDRPPWLEAIRALARSGARVAVVHPHPMGYGLEPVIDLTGRLDVPRLVALVASSAAVLGPDTGVLHVAGSLRKPAVGVFTTWPSALRLSWYDAVALEPGPLTCHPCWDRTCPASWCTGWARPQAIAAAVAEVLAPRWRLGLAAEADGPETWCRYGSPRTEVPDALEPVSFAGAVPRSSRELPVTAGG